MVNKNTGAAKKKRRRREQRRANKADDNSKSDEDSQALQKKPRNSKWNTSYAAMTIEQAQRRLGIRLDKVKTVPIDRMLYERLGVNKETSDAVRETVYDRIVEYIIIEGYPTEASWDFKETNVSDLVLYTIGPILAGVRNTGRSIRLRREREIVSVDGETGGNEEFVVVDEITVEKDKFVLIIEAKRSSTGQALKQIMLSLKDARDNNEGGTVYGFITTGQHWKMLSYDGAEFVMTDEFTVVFDTMQDNKEKWMKENSVVVDCVVVALTNGGIVKDVVVQG